jgi:hypothetical protein
LDEILAAIEPAISRSELQGCRPTLIFEVKHAFMPQQQSEDIDVATTRCSMKRCVVVYVCLVDVNAVERQQSIDNRRLIERSCIVDRSGARSGCCVDITPGADECGAYPLRVVTSSPV